MLENGFGGVELLIDQRGYCMYDIGLGAFYQLKVFWVDILSGFIT